MDKVVYLQTPKSGKVTKLIHISDTHIRSGDADMCRYLEYKTVFENLYSSLKQQECIINETGIIVVTGDIFHHKNKIEAGGIELFNDLMANLGSIAPTFLIKGNHDYRQDQPLSPDMLSAFFKQNSFPNVTYLEKSGYYICGNIGFGYISVEETLLENAFSGQVDELPDFPDPSCLNLDTTVALFHGTIVNCVLDNYSSSLKGYPLEWFKGYKYGIFGDIHLRQTNHSERLGLTWGYSGSLLQQNFGETICNKGYLVWDFINDTVTPVDVFNPYGLIKCKVTEDGNWSVLNYTEGDTEGKGTLTEFLKDKLLPKQIKIRILGKNSTDNLISLESTLEGIVNYEYDYQLLNEDNVTKNFEVDNTEDLSEYNTKERWISFLKKRDNFEEVWEDYILDPHKILLSNDVPSGCIEKVKSKNSDIEQLIDKLHCSLETGNSKKNFKLLYIDFQYILCFGKQNYFNFSDLSGNVALISAENGQGKTSFLETICFALFGVPIPSRSNKSVSISMLSCQRPKGTRPFTRIFLELKGETYEIYRLFGQHRKDQTKLTMEKVELAKASSTGDRIVLRSGSKKVEEWVKECVGDINDFLLSCMITQNDDRNFLTLKSDEQMLMLDKCLKFDSLNGLKELLKVTINCHKYIIDLLDTYVYKKSDEVIDLTKLEGTLKLKEQQKKKIAEELKAVCTSRSTNVKEIDLQQSKEIIAEKIQYYKNLLGDGVVNLPVEKYRYECETRFSKEKPWVCVPTVPVDITLLEQRLKGTDSLVPKVDLQNELNELSKEMAINKKYNTESLLDSIEEKKDVINKAIDKLDQMQDTFEELETEIENNGNQKDTFFNKLSTLKNINLPSLTEDELHSKLQAIEKDTAENESKIVSKNEKLKQQLELVNSVQKKIDKETERMDYYISRMNELSDTLKEIPYNPDCAACKQQPTRIQLMKNSEASEQSLRAVESLTTELDDLLKGKPLEEIVHKQNKFQNWINQLNTEKAKVGDYKKLLGDWSEYNKCLMYKQTLNKEMDYLKDEIKKNLDKKKALKVDIDALQLTYENDKKEYDELNFVKDNRERWLLSHKRINQQLSLWTEYEKKENDYVNQLRCIYNWIVIQDNLKYHQTVLEAKSNYDTKVKLTNQLDQVSQERDKVFQDYIIQVEKKKQNEDLQKKQKCLQLTMEVLETKKESIIRLSKEFDSYRNWIYKEIVFPKLLNKTNELINSVCHKGNGSVSGNLQLTYKLSETNTIHWVMIDGLNRVSIEKASGFQRFMLGVALRIALSYIGASSVLCRQLFIDEGFTACDRFHLNRVPVFIEGLLSLFESIVIVSHLDIIKDNIKTVIHIQRDKSVSTINYGNTIEMKKNAVGRPKKYQVN
jgi:DNA repair exonuclease SbcCD ATPase subunit/DNA repair exonuclease SbcCD nuclease subunit